MEELSDLKETYKTNSEDFNDIIVGLTGPESVNDSFKGQYNSDTEPGLTNSNVEFKCGPLVSGNDYPVMPSSDEYTKFLSSTANVVQTTDWTKIKSSELMTVEAENISSNGVDLNIFVDGTFIDINGETPSDELQALLRYEGLDTSKQSMQKYTMKQYKIYLIFQVLKNFWDQIILI